MYSTLDDMQRWARAIFLNDTLLTRAQRAALLPREGYAFGIQHQRMTTGEGQTVDVLMHTGQIAGTFAWVAFLPELGRYVVVLSNIGFTFPQAQFMRSVVAALRGPVSR